MYREWGLGRGNFMTDHSRLRHRLRAPALFGMALLGAVASLAVAQPALAQGNGNGNHGNGYGNGGGDGSNGHGGGRGNDRYDAPVPILAGGIPGLLSLGGA